MLVGWMESRKAKPMGYLKVVVKAVCLASRMVWKLAVETVVDWDQRKANMKVEKMDCCSVASTDV